MRPVIFVRMRFEICREMDKYSRFVKMQVSHTSGYDFVILTNATMYAIDCHKAT